VVWATGLTLELLAIAGCTSSTGKMTDATVNYRDGAPEQGPDVREQDDGGMGDGGVNEDVIDDTAADRGAANVGDALPEAGAAQDASSQDSGETGSACVIAAYNGPVPVPATPATSCVPASTADVWSQEQLMPPSSSATNVFALSPTDVWLSMDVRVLHWDGVSWTTAFDVPPNEQASFGAMWASRGDDLWVGTGDGMRHWDGETLTDPVWPGTVVMDVHGLAADDVWATLWNSQYLIHWDGSSWSQITPFAAGTFRPSFDWIQSVWPVSRNDVWVATYDGDMFHWDGSTWNTVSTCFQPGNNLYEMWGASSDDIWLSTRLGIFHYDGVAWTQIDRNIWGNELWGTCAHDIWMRLEDGPGMAHFDGVKWSRVVVPSGDSIHGSGPDDVWISTAYIVYHRHVAPPTAVCGNYRVDPGETCDPPDGVDGTCDGLCQRHVGCGDGIIEAGEECDPPEPHVCTLYTCQLIPECGNGLLDPGEQCDPPTQLLGSDICDATCQIPRCGNGIVDPGEDCDPPSPIPGDLPYKSPIYCGSDCKTHDACKDCHQQCDSSPLGFAACRPSCAAGHYLNC